MATTPAAAICDECLDLARDIVPEACDQEESLGETQPTEEEPTRPEHREPVLSCSFCGKHQDHVRKLVAGPTVYICNECVARLSKSG